MNFFGQVLRIMDTKILENYISLILLIYRPTYPIHTDPIRIALLITNKPERHEKFNHIIALYTVAEKGKPVISYQFTDDFIKPIKPLRAIDARSSSNRLHMDYTRADPLIKREVPRRVHECDCPREITTGRTRVRFPSVIPMLLQQTKERRQRAITGVWTRRGKKRICVYKKT